MATVIERIYSVDKKSFGGVMKNKIVQNEYIHRMIDTYYIPCTYQFTFRLFCRMLSTNGYYRTLSDYYFIYDFKYKCLTKSLFLDNGHLFFSERFGWLPNLSVWQCAEPIFSNASVYFHKPINSSGFFNPYIFISSYDKW